MLTSTGYSIQVFCNPFITCFVLHCVTQSNANLWNPQCHHLHYLLLGKPKTPIWHTSIFISFHSKFSPPYLTFSLLLTAYLLSKAYLFISSAHLLSPGHCSLNLRERQSLSHFMLNLFLSMWFFPSTSKHEVTSHIEKKIKENLNLVAPSRWWPLSISFHKLFKKRCYFPSFYNMAGCLRSF